MGQIFNVDGKIYAVFSRAADLVILNILWLVCSIPIITIGASTTAMYSVLLKMVRNEENYLVSSFFGAFKENLKQALGIWMAILLAAIVLYFDFYYSAHAAWEGARLLLIPLGIAAFLLAALQAYVFPVLAYFINDSKKAVKNSLLMGIAYLPYTIVLLFVNLCPVLVLFMGNPAAAAFGDAVIGFALAAFVNAHILRRLFDRVQVKK